jgi:hypothetical protein
MQVSGSVTTDEGDATRIPVRRVSAAIYKKAFHHGAPLWRYLSATAPAAARGAAFAARGAAAAFFAFGAAFFAGFALARADVFALRPRADDDDFFLAERDELLVFMARSLYGNASQVATRDASQCTIRFSSKIGSRMASTMNSTTPPMKTMMIGSRMVVSPRTAFSTSSSYASAALPSIASS